jgi:hypothetical protein
LARWTCYWRRRLCSRAERLKSCRASAGLWSGAVSPSAALLEGLQVHVMLWGWRDMAWMCYFTWWGIERWLFRGFRTWGVQREATSPAVPLCGRGWAALAWGLSVYLVSALLHSIACCLALLIHSRLATFATYCRGAMLLRTGRTCSLLLHVAPGVSAAPTPQPLCFPRVHRLRGVAELRLSMLSLAWHPAEPPEHCARCTQL